MKQDKPGFFSKLLGHTFLILNIGAVIWLLVCAIVPYIHPANTNHIALFGLTTPIVVILNVLFVFFWLFTRKKLRFLISLLALACSYKVIVTIFAFNFGEENDMSHKPGRIRIMSWNAHGMGVFKIPHDKSFDKRVLEFLNAQNADILCLPEYAVPKTNPLKPYGSKIIKDNGYRDFRFKDDNSLGTKIFLGTAVFSKFPFKNYVVYKLSYETCLLQGDIELPGGQMMRMFFLHLSTFGLSDEEKAYIEKVKRNNPASEVSEQRSRTFIWKFNQAYKKRALEADKATDIIKQSPYPVLICGDFNDLPGSYTYRTLRGQLSDAFLEKGLGLGRTYNEISPTIRIDHMFYDPAVLKPVGFSCPYTSLSDHNPLIVNFEIIAKAGH